jgi:hypothetical protein
VLLGVTLRRGLPPGAPAPTRPPRLINVTIWVDDLSLNYARGRAVVEGTSVSRWSTACWRSTRAFRGRPARRSAAGSPCSASAAFGRSKASTTSELHDGT